MHILDHGRIKIFFFFIFEIKIKVKDNIQTNISETNTTQMSAILNKKYLNLCKAHGISN